MMIGTGMIGAEMIGIGMIATEMIEIGMIMVKAEAVIGAGNELWNR